MTAILSEWGPNGVEALRDRVGVLVIVDVLSFCTAVDVAASRGALVVPCPEHGIEVPGAVPAARRGEPGFSLSPASLVAIPPGTRLALPSPNGARLSLAAGGVMTFAACLRNAGAVARAARRAAGGRPVGVVPAGERWPDGSLRPALEDLLGAGAVVHHLDGAPSPEARAARDAYRAAGADRPRLIRRTPSGEELVARGFGEDVRLATEEEASATAPRLVDGAYRA